MGASYELTAIHTRECQAELFCKGLKKPAVYRSRAALPTHCDRSFFQHQIRIITLDFQADTVTRQAAEIQNRYDRVLLDLC